MANKIEEILTQAKIKDLLGKSEPVVIEKKKKCNPLVCILAILGAITAFAGIAYAVYKYLTPDYLEGFEDEEDEEDDEEDFDDDFFEEEESKEDDDDEE